MYAIIGRVNTTSIVIQPDNPDCQDRAEIILCEGRTLLVLAEGAGGITGGSQAAEALVQLVRASADHLHSADDCVRLLEAADQDLASRRGCGETTGVVVVVDASNIFGASVGDSAAWLFTAGGSGELTYGQQRKPLLGSGEIARPRGYTWPIEPGTLVVASDGLWKYASMEAIRSRVQTRESADLALRLAELARLPSGAFPDDAAVITYRIGG